MKKHKDTKEIESTMIRVSKVQRDMELSEYNRKGILKTLRKVQKPSMAFQKYCNDKIKCLKCTDNAYKQTKCMKKWVDAHCEVVR